MKDFIKQDYQQFKASDFALEESFIDWVKNKNPEAESFWSDWVQKNPHMKEEIQLARALVLSMQFREREFPISQVNTEWKRLRNKPFGRQQHARSKTSVIPLKSVISIAAVLLLIATFLFMIQWVNNPSFGLKEPVMLVKEAPKGQKLSIVLPDGSEIKLNSDSKIRFPSRFTGDYREVVLEGEAFFDVVHQEKMPFKVRVGEVTVEVLGTSFNVEAYSGNPEILIALVEGSVKVNTQRAATNGLDLFLKPNEMIGIDKKDLSHHIRHFDLQEVVGWKDGYLFFTKVDFEKTIAKLERWYGVKFEIDPKVEIDPDWRFNGKFQNKSLEYILRTFSYPELFRYRIEEQKVMIY